MLLEAVKAIINREAVILYIQVFTKILLGNLLVNMHRRPTQDMGKLKCIDWRCEVESKDLVSLRSFCEALLYLALCSVTSEF